MVTSNNYWGAVLRSIAYKVTIAQLLAGEFKPSQGEYDPAFVRIGLKEVNRCNILGTIVAVNPLLMDDSTAQIKLLVFDERVKAGEGDIVRVIGKVREKEGERFISAEIIKPVTEQELELRKLELNKPTPKTEITEIEV